MLRSAASVACLALLLGISGTACGGDWPQILGPTRNGIAAADEKIAAQWPAAGPRQVWQVSVGRGVAGVAVAGEHVLLFDRISDRERVQSLSVDTGKPQWGQEYSTRFVPQYGREDGPLCVPTVSGESVVTFGAEGVLSCYDLESGAVVWQRDTQSEFDALEGFFGAGSSPLVEDGKVIVNVGGRDAGAGIVAFDLLTGRPLWQAIKDGASYSSPIAATVGGARRIVALTRLKCVVLDPADGTVQFEFPYGLRGATVTAANPLVLHGHLFLSASYGIGALFARIDGPQPQTVWESDDLMSSQYTTCVEHEGLLYGIDGRQDIPPADLKCFNPVTQKVVWSEPGFGYATLIKADGKLLVMKTDGELVLAKLGGNRFQPLARATLFKDADPMRNPVRALPALANGRLYVRDGRALKCVDLRPAP